MSPFDRVPSPSGFDQTDPVAASAQQALAHWRSAFDDRLEALERALRGPADAGELSALIMDFTRVAGEEAEAAARQSTLDAQTSAWQASQTADRHEREAAQAALAEARRQHNDARQALDATRRAHEETRRAYDSAVRALDDAQRALQEAYRETADAQRLAGDAEHRAQQADEERRELVGIQTQLQAQLDAARTDAQDANAEIASLREELTEAKRDAEGRGRELQAFRRRLEQAVQDAEERSRAQEAERVRLEHEIAEVSARATEVTRERDAAQHELARVSSQLELLRPQVEAASAQIVGLEQELRERNQVIDALQQTERTATRAKAEDRPEASTQAAPLVSEVSPVSPPTADVVVPDAVIVSPEAAEPAQPAASEAMEWLQSLREPVGAAERASAGDPLTAESTDAIDDAAGDDPPLSPESTGVFSTVADALRAWTTEAPEPGERAPAATSSPAGLSATAPDAGAESLRPEVPQYDIVRQTVRYDLVARRIQVMIDQEPGQLVDLSSGGAQVVTSSMLKPGRQVRLTFPAAGPLATARAKIAWSRLEPPTHGGGELQYRAGVTFVKVDAKTIERVLNVTAPPRG